MRPDPLTPKNDVMSRALFWLTIATRSPWPMPSRSSPAAWARASSATRLYVSSPHDSRRLVGLVDQTDAVAVDELGAPEEVHNSQRNLHAAHSTHAP